MSLTLLMQMSPQQALAFQGPGYAYLTKLPGNYNDMNSTKILETAHELTLKDREYIANTIKAINASIQSFINDNVKGGIAKMSDESQVPGGSVDLKAFLAERRNFNSSVASINTLIQSLTAIPEVGAINGRTITIQGDKVLIDGAVKADFSGIKAQWQKLINSIESSSEELKFIVKHDAVGVVTQIGIKNLHEKLQNPFNAAELNKLRTQAANLRITPADTRRQINTTVNKMTTDSMRGAIDTYGRITKLRLTPQQEETNRAQALIALEKLMFSRSLIRIMYGIKTGTPIIRYDMKKFNWDFFSSTNDLKFYSESALDENEQRRILTEVTAALTTQEARTKDVFGGSVISTFDVLSRASSAFNWLKGEKQFSRMNAVILNLLMADIREDLQLGQIGGLRGLKDMFKKRYYNTPENEKYYRQMKNDVVALLEPSLSAASGDSDGYGDVGSADNGANGALKMAATAFQNQRANIEQADQIAEYEGKSKQKNNTGRRLEGL
jgi:hypothetical protein